MNFNLFLEITILFTADLKAQFPGAGNAIDFQNGRQIIAPTGGNLSPTSTHESLTAEAWIFWRGNSGGDSGIMEGRGDGLHFEITDNNGRLRIRVNDNDDLVINNIVPQNEWVHLAFVYDNTPGNEEIRAYKNGEFIGSRLGESGSSSDFSSMLRFGVSCCADVTPINNNRPFNGLIDEIRVWYKAKTPAEIREQMCKKLTLPQTDLTLYYRLDEIVNDTVYDLSGNENHGLVDNINAADHLELSGAPLGDESEFWHDVPFAGNTFYCESNLGDSLGVNNIAGSPDGLHIYSVNEVPNSTAGISGLGANSHYYGVFMANDNSASFDATYFYGNNPAFLASAPTINENDVTLYIRDNNEQTIWANSGAPINLGNQTLTTNNTFRQEYILGLDNPDALPVELIEFTANYNSTDNTVGLNWTTATERENDYFTIERSKNGFDFEEVTVIDGAGNSIEELNYSTIDNNPHTGISYYRLKQTDFEGTFSFSDMRSVKIDTDVGLKIYPNPVSSGEEVNVDIDQSAEEMGSYQIIDMTGKIILDGFVKNNTLKFNISSGVYIFKYQGEDRLITEKFVVN